MRKFYFSLLLVICAVSCLQFAAQSICRTAIPAHLSFATDSESRLALGGRLNLWQSGVYDLELIPRISDKLARRMLLGKAEMKARASEELSREKYLALQAVNGIGPKTAERLSHYLDLRSGCCDTPPSRQRSR